MPKYMHDTEQAYSSLKALLAEAVAQEREALDEALDGWKGLAQCAEMSPIWPGWKRIAELRSRSQPQTKEDDHG